MKRNTKLSLIAFIALSISVSSCKKDKKELPKVNEGELITTIKLTFTEANNPSNTKTFTWRDIDGEGGDAPVIDDIILASNKIYNMEVTQILNETTTPPEDIIEEIKEEDYDHLLVYKPSVDLLTVQITDKDKNNIKVGLKGTVTTAATKNGTLQIILRHQPGVKDGTEAPGSTDFDIMFNLKVI